MKRLIIIVMSLILVTGCSNSNEEANTYKTLEGNKVDSMVESGAIIIDVRTLEEYEEDHIENAINIPLDDINNGDIDYDKDETIIVYCRSGARSESAALKLIELGYTNVYDLGSINNYK